MTHTLPAPPRRHQDATPVSWHLSQALLGEPGWDVRAQRLDPELDDLWLLVNPAPESTREVPCPQ